MDDLLALIGGVVLGASCMLLTIIGARPDYSKPITEQVCQPRCALGEVAKFELKDNKILCFCSLTKER